MTFAIGTLVGFLGLLGVIFFDGLKETWKVYLPSFARTFLATCLVVGFLVHNVSFFMLRSARNRVVRTAAQSPNTFFWMRLVAVILWLGVLPFACLWVYDYIKHPH